MKCHQILLAPLFPQVESKALSRKALQLAGGLGAQLEKLAPGEQPLYAEILHQVRQRRPDLLILESAVDLPTKQPWSQAERCLIDRCPCPVLLVRSSRTYSNPTVVAAVHPEAARGKTAELDEEILNAAGILTAGLRARLVIYHATRPLWESDVPAWQQPLTDGHLRVPAGEPAACLRAASANIVVMGFTHRSCLGRILEGDIAERAAAASTSDLLIVKPLLNQATRPSEPAQPSAAAIVNQLRQPAGHATH